ncbi:hypothetical protein H1D31_09365 [Alishewanella sp. BS5-314]|uniref:hypothetical protein n=1 Tax=Alishewanella sp. BS5-314 TaxID=2755587 RepID=UPI0021BB030D|nr:hypothetical protein [Alishewanella sp. BS5-314]MCT8126222.1 hypothetical protein [Alishewanella sp. BS5-314]
MLRHYRALARCLKPWRPLLLLAALLTAAGFFWQLLPGNGQGPYLLPTLVSAILFLCLLLLVQFFGTERPAPASRWRRALATLWQGLLAVLLTLILLSWFFLFLKALSAIIRLHFF